MVVTFLKAYLFSSRANSHVKKMAWISLTGITLGTFSLIVVLSVMSGLNKASEERLLKNEAHLVVENTDKAFEARVKKIKGTKTSHIFEMQDVLIKTAAGLFNGAEAIGIEKRALKEKKSFYSADQTRLLNDLSEFSSGEGVLLGFDLFVELNLVVGDSIELYKPEAIVKGQMDLDFSDFKSFRVLGVLNSESGNREARTIFYQYGKLFKGKSLSLTSGHEVFLKDPQGTETAKSKLESYGYEVESWRDRNAVLFLALKLEKLSMTFLLGLALLITSFSIMTLLILIVVQKQKDIGILLSMGFSKFKIRLLFGGIGVGVSLFGIFTGAFLGVLVSVLLDLFPVKILPPIYQDPYLPADFSFFTLGWVLFFCSFVAILSSLVPIFYLSRVTPVSALKETTRF